MYVRSVYVCVCVCLCEASLFGNQKWKTEMVKSGAVEQAKELGGQVSCKLTTKKKKKGNSLLTIAALHQLHLLIYNYTYVAKEFATLLL